jgi:iron complex transport system permease protein
MLVVKEYVAKKSAWSVVSFWWIVSCVLIIPIIIITICLVISLLLSKQINVLCLGNNTASALGINIKAIRTICIIIASLSAASVVSFSGLIGFIGLIVPHMARKISGNKTKPLLINSCILGSIITVIADLLGRTLFSPSEMPVGIMLAFIGGPFFIFLLLKQRGKL